MPVIINEVAKNKASANKKRKELKEYYRPYYNSVTSTVRKITPLMKKRDKNLKGYSYHIQVKLSYPHKKRRKK